MKFSRSFRLSWPGEQAGQAVFIHGLIEGSVLVDTESEMLDTLAG